MQKAWRGILSAVLLLLLFTGCKSNALPRLCIGEVVSDNGGSLTDAAGGTPDWVELFNPGDTALDISGYGLSDDHKNIKKFVFPAGTTVEAKGCLVVYLVGASGTATEGALCAPFALSKNGEYLYLTNASAALLQQLTIPELATDISYARRKDGSYGYSDQASPGKENDDANIRSTQSELVPGDKVSVAMDKTDPVRINEVLMENRAGITDGDGDRSEWVELKNNGQTTVSLSGYFLSDDPAKPLKWALPEISLAPGEYLVVFLSGKDRTQGELHASFGLSSKDTAVVLTQSTDGEELRQDVFLLPEICPDTASVGRDEDGNTVYYGLPTPGYDNAKGFTLADEVGFFDVTGVVISEVCAVSDRTEETDWIELYNGKSTAADLSGWYLSDSLNDPTQWQIPSLVIESHGYAVIPASARAAKRTDGMATFGISPDGETIVLSDPDGHPQDVFTTGALAAGQTAGRLLTDATVQRVLFRSPTRGYENGGRYYEGVMGQVVLSDTALYHAETFTVTLTCTDKNAVIRYTTDGDEPGTWSDDYTVPIEIRKNTVLRARAYDADGKAAPGAIANATYLFDAPATVPVVSILGEKTAMRQVFTQSDMNYKPEREAYITCYDESGMTLAGFPAGVVCKGKGSAGYRQKSVTVHLRARYGQSNVTYPFWDDNDMTTFTGFVLRNSGQDMDKARIRDSLTSRIALGIRADVATTRLCVVYLNGSYQGLYDFNEDVNADSLSAHFGVDPDMVEMVFRNDTVLCGTDDDFQRVRQFARTQDLSDDAIFQEFAQWVDVEACTDFIIAKSIFCDIDTANMRYWHTTDNTVRWRPIFYDLDWSMDQGGGSRNVLRRFFLREGYGYKFDGTRTNVDIFYGLYKNAAWRDACAERFCELLSTTFSVSRMMTIAEEMAEKQKPEMARQIEKWGGAGSVYLWEKQYLSRVYGFLRVSHSRIYQVIQQELKISSARMKQLREKYPDN